MGKKNVVQQKHEIIYGSFLLKKKKKPSSTMEARSCNIESEFGEDMGRGRRLSWHVRNSWV